MKKKPIVAEADRRIAEWKGGGLNLAGLGLTEVPFQVFNLAALTRLDLSHNQLSELPAEIRNLTALTRLNLSGNQLSELPTEIGVLTQLTLLYLGDNKLSELPPEFGSLSGLRELSLYDNQLSELPVEIRHLTALTNLDLQGNQLSKLPAEIGNLTALTSLKLSGNQLSELPAEIGNLIALRELGLFENHLSKLPTEIGQLTALTRLSLGENDFSKFPQEIGNFTALTELYLSNNHLSEIPARIGNLTQLKGLYLSNNHLSELPAEIGNLTELMRLTLDRNRLSTLPAEVGNLPNLTTLRLEGNPLPREIFALANNLDQLKRFLRELASGSPFPLREIKLIFLGPPDIGKTCLLGKLQGKPFQKGYRSTMAFDIGREPVELGTGPEVIQANCWDFGGQEKYEITHQFFFSCDTVFVVAWKPRQDTTQLREWLQLIKHRAGEHAPVMIVATYRDEPQHSAGRFEAAIRKEFPGVREFFWVTNLDAVPDDHRHPAVAAQAILDSAVEIQKLKAAVFEVAKEKMIQDFPNARRLTRERIRGLKETCIRLHECRKLCADQVPPEVLDALLIQMDAIGDIVFFPSGSDEDLIILQPQWLGKAIGYAMDDPLLEPGDGEVPHATLALVWDQYRNEGYAPEHYPYFLWLMERFNLAYRIDEHRSLIPQLVRADRPSAVPFCPSDATEGVKQCAFQWTVKGTDAPKGLVPLLTASLDDWRRGVDRSQQRNWRTGLAITTHAGPCVFIELNDRVLTVAMRAQFPALLIENLANAVSRIIEDTWPGVQVALEYPCRHCLAENLHPQGGFPVSAYRDRLDTFPLLCPQCGTETTLGELRRGYRIDLEMEALKEQLKVTGVMSKEMAEMTRSLLFRSSTHPNKVSLTESESTAGDLGFDVYSLNVYCDHPGHDQPVASYPLKVPKKWLSVTKGFVHWTGVIAKGAGLVVPGLAAIGHLTAADLGDKEWEALFKGIDAVTGSGLDIGESYELRSETGTDAYERVLSFLLDQVAKDGKFYGGLARQYRDSRVMWLCSEHLDSVPIVP